MIYLPSKNIILFWQGSAPVTNVGWLDLIWLLIQTAFALALVCGLAVFIFRYVLPRLNAVSFNRSIVRVIDSTSLDARKRLVIIEVAGKYLLLAISENGVQTISELDGESIEKALADLSERQKNDNQQLGKFTDSFTQTLERVRQKWM